MSTRQFLLWFCAFAHIGISSDEKLEFDTDDLENFRQEIIKIIYRTDDNGFETRGIGFNNDELFTPLLDGLVSGEMPIAPTLLRLAFHDCAGLKEDSTTYMCDGCIEMDSIDNLGLRIGAIEEIEDICYSYKIANGLSTADCWSLASTVAVEITANRTKTTQLRAFIPGFNPEEEDIKVGDIPYLIGRKDCHTSPKAHSNTIFPGFSQKAGWDQTSGRMKTVFPGLTNLEVVALVGGGHSVGRGHAKITNTPFSWDVSPDALDNDYYLTLLNIEPLSKVIGLNLDFFQARLVDPIENPALLAANNGVPTDITFTTHLPMHLRVLLNIPNISVPLQKTKTIKYFNSDVSMAFDLRQWSDTPDEITCHTDAKSVCGDKIVLIDGYEPPVVTGDVCQFKQCPLQCPDISFPFTGGYARFGSIFHGLDIDFTNFTNIMANTLPIIERLKQYAEDDPESTCIVAYVWLFALDGKYFAEVFKTAYVKMITNGYTIGSAPDSDSHSHSHSDSSSGEEEQYVLYEVPLPSGCNKHFGLASDQLVG
eukprot:972992_1